MDAEREQRSGRPGLALVEEPPDTPPGERRPKRRWIIGVLAFAVVATIVAFSIMPRIQARSVVHKETAQMALPYVSVVRPKQSAPAEEVILPANVQAYYDAPIYARTNGYLKKWYVDIGARVRKGQLLAEIDTPEVDQQLRQARANLATAQANLALSETTSARYQGLLKTNSVAQQEADNATGAYAANKAIVQSNQADVSRLEQLQSFEKIYAPFNGVITVRNTDVGALITAGSGGGPGTELFHISQPDILRAYVKVPEAYAPSAKPGLTADFTLAEFPGRRIEGKLVRSANAIDPTTRTLLVEVDVKNPTGKLFSGAYAEVHLKVPGAASTFIIPVNTLLFRSEGLRVVTITDGKAQLIPLTLGRDFGSEVEVVTGLKGDENIVINPPDSLIAGQAVRIAQPGGSGGS